MRKYSNLLMSACVMFAGALTISACKDDDPPVPPSVAFEASTRTVKESDGTIEVKVVLDKPAPEDITVKYTIGGTAVEEVAAAGQHASDYAISSDYKEVKIAKGATEGIIELELFSDTDLEDDETITLAIASVTPVDVKPAVPDDITITVKQEDGLIVALTWGEEGVAYTDVDMDLILWVTNNAGTLVPNFQFLGYSGDYNTNLVEAFTPRIEYFFFPGVVADGTYGISANYYSGTREPMKFTVTYVEVVNGAEAASVDKQGTYTLQNINAWTEENAPQVLLAGTFKKVGSDFTDFSDLTIAATGSRSGSFDVPSGIQRKHGSFSINSSLSKILGNKK